MIKCLNYSLHSAWVILLPVAPFIEEIQFSITQKTITAVSVYRQSWFDEQNSVPNEAII